jgi:Ferritin-like domain
LVVTRRGFLATAGALLVAGCGREEARRDPPSDADVLRGLLPVELAAGGAVIGSPLAELLAREDARHARRLAALAGIAPEPRAPAAHGLEMALARKQEAVFEYIAALPKLTEPGARAAVMQILASEAGHLAALREAAGDEPVPDPFAGYL